MYIILSILEDLELFNLSFKNLILNQKKFNYSIFNENNDDIKI